MTADSKEPEQSLHEQLLAERDAILAEIAPLEAKARELQGAMDRATAAWRKVREEIVAIERARGLADLSRRIRATAPNLKYSLSAGPIQK